MHAYKLGLKVSSQILHHNLAINTAAVPEYPNNIMVSQTTATAEPEQVVVTPAQQGQSGQLASSQSGQPDQPQAEIPPSTTVVYLI